MNHPRHLELFGNETNKYNERGYGREKLKIVSRQIIIGLRIGNYKDKND
jgi:hypothetical protein